MRNPTNVIYHTDRTRGRKHTVLLTDVEKAFDKIHHLFMIKTIRKLGMEGNSLNMIKRAFIKKQKQKLTANIILSSQRLESHPKIRNKTRMPTFTTAIQHHFESSGQSN